MPGFSLTLLLLPPDHEVSAPSASLLLSLLDEPAETPGWKWTSGAPPTKDVPMTLVGPGNAQTQVSFKSASSDDDLFVKGITRACQGLVDAESQITKMDQIAGDGDCGMTLKAGAQGAILVTGNAVSG